MPRASSKQYQRRLENLSVRWTPEREALLVKLYADGVSQIEVCAQLGLSVKAVQGRVRKLGIGRGKKARGTIGALKAAGRGREFVLLKSCCCPRHALRLQEGSREWFDACNKAFCATMEANPDIRPTDVKLKHKLVGPTKSSRMIIASKPVYASSRAIW